MLREADAVRLARLVPAAPALASGALRAARLAFRRFFRAAVPVDLNQLRTLTPADFAVVRRRAAVRGGERDAALLLRLLAAECEGRAGGRGPIGFARPEVVA